MTFKALGKAKLILGKLDRTMVGIDWIEEYLSMMSEDVTRKVKGYEKKSQTKFRIGDGEESNNFKSYNPYFER